MDWKNLLDQNRIICESCGYRSRPLDYNGHWYICGQCHEIVNAEIVPFLFVPGICSDCHSELSRESRIYASDFKEHQHQCPKCGSRSLAQDFPVEILPSFSHGEIPKKNQIIHGLVISRSATSDFHRLLMVPQVSITVRFEIEPDGLNSLTDGFYEFEVLSANKQIIRLKLLGPLPAERGWPGYYRRVD